MQNGEKYLTILSSNEAEQKTTFVAGFVAAMEVFGVYCPENTSDFGDHRLQNHIMAKIAATATQHEYMARQEARIVVNKFAHVDKAKSNAMAMLFDVEAIDDSGKPTGKPWPMYTMKTSDDGKTEKINVSTIYDEKTGTEITLRDDDTLFAAFVELLIGIGDLTYDMLVERPDVIEKLQRRFYMNVTDRFSAFREHSAEDKAKPMVCGKVKTGHCECDKTGDE